MTAKILSITALLAAMLMPAAASARQPERGYRGFAEWIGDVKADISLGGDGGVSSISDSKFFTGVSVSQGYQFNHWLFVGGGVAAEQCVKDNEIYAAPVFANARFDLKFGKFTPFGDVKLGYNFAGYGGIYFTPTVGYRINWGSKMGINIGLGYTMTGNRREIEKVTTILGPDGMGGTNTTYHRRHTFDSTIALRLGFDF